MLFTKLYNAQGNTRTSLSPYISTVHSCNKCHNISVLACGVQTYFNLLYLFVALFSTLYCELFIFSLLLVLIYEFVYYLHTQNVPLP